MTFAYNCIFLAMMLPLFWAGMAKRDSETPFDNNAPRDHIAQLKGKAKSAYCIEQNSYESFPPFAIAVVVAHLTGGVQLTVDILAGIYVVSRVIFGLCYLQSKGTMRSITFMVGLACTVALFFVGS